MMVSHAQNFEDVILWRALKGVERGFYIDVGAHHPIIDSVSLLFYERGWRGLHVEPMPEMAAKLREGRPDEIVVQAAVTTRSGPVELLQIGSSGLTTGDQDIGREHMANGWPGEAIIAEAVRLADVFEKASDRDVHWLKIDVEGMEQDVIASWGDAECRPWIVVVESTLPLSEIPSHEQWERLVTERGYDFVYFDGLNRFYVHNTRPQLKAVFGPGPNLWDGFAFNDTASSAPTFGAVYIEKLRAVEENRRIISGDLASSQAVVSTRDAEIGALQQQTHQLSGALEQAVSDLGARDVALAERVGEVGRLREELAGARAESAAALDVERKRVAALEAAIDAQRQALIASSVAQRELRGSMEAVLSNMRQLRAETADVFAAWERRRFTPRRFLSRLRSVLSQGGQRAQAAGHARASSLGGVLETSSLPHGRAAARHAEFLTNDLFAREHPSCGGIVAAEALMLEGLFERLKPRVALEINMAGVTGWPLSNDYCLHAYAIQSHGDKNLGKNVARDLRVNFGPLAHELPSIFNEFDVAGEPLDLIVMAGDGAQSEIRDAIGLVLGYRPMVPFVVVIWKAGERACRDALCSVSWAANPHVHGVDLDFLPGRPSCNASEEGQLRGGVALVYLSPAPRAGELVVKGKGASAAVSPAGST